MTCGIGFPTTFINIQSLVKGDLGTNYETDVQCQRINLFFSHVPFWKFGKHNLRKFEEMILKHMEDRRELVAMSYLPKAGNR